MGLARSLRAVVDQFGGAGNDYDEYGDYDDDTFTEPTDHAGVGEAPRRGSRGSADFDEIYRDDSRRHSPQARERAGRPLAIVRPSRLEFALVTPKDFDNAQEIAKRLRAATPVIVDLQGCGPDLSKRLTDFCSGLTYALEGELQFIGESVLLLAPHGVELSSESPGGLHERRFFNQV
jgi:cell division inhibitor SepF